MVIGNSRSLNWSKTRMELIGLFNSWGEFRWSPQGPVSQIHSPHFYVGAPWNIFWSLRSVQMLKIDWSAESNGKLPHLFIPNKTATLVPEFAVEDIPLSRTAALAPGFPGKDLPLDRTLRWWWSWLYFICRSISYVSKKILAKRYLKLVAFVTCFMVGCAQCCKSKVKK